MDIKEEPGDMLETEMCPVCLMTVGGGQVYKDHLVTCVHINRPSINNQQFMIAKTEEKKQAVKLQHKCVSCKAEQLDVRQLHKSSQDLGSRYFENIDQKLFSQSEIDSVDIMEKSCFPDISINVGSNQNYFCDNCVKSFATPQQFAAHLYAHTFVKKKRDLESLLCTGCGEYFCDKTSWDSHQIDKSCPGLPKTIFGCILCSKIFTRKDGLRNHLKAQVYNMT